jgi:hypothetical protein
MPDLKPSTWLGAGYSQTGNTIVLNTSDAASNKTLPQLTNALANATTGDIRSVAFALSEALFQAWVAQSANQPGKMTLRRIAQTDAGNTIRYSYVFDFVITPGVPSLVASE